MRRLLLPLTAAAALAIPAPAMAVGALDQSQDGGFAGSNVVWGSVQAAQSFTAGISGDLDQVDVLLARSGSPGDLTVEIQTLSSGVPSGTVLASGSVAAASVTGSYAWIPVPLSPVAPSSAGVQYAIVLSAPSSAGSGDRYDWAITGGSPYVGRDPALQLGRRGELDRGGPDLRLELQDLRRGLDPRPIPRSTPAPRA